MSTPESAPAAPDTDPDPVATPAGVRRGLSAAKRAVNGPNRPALVISLLMSLFAALFVTSYSLAMGNPQPHDIPVGVISQTVTPERLEKDLQALTGTTFLVSEYPSVAAATEALNEQQIYGAFVSGAAGSTSGELIISSASGASVAKLIAADATALGAKFGVTVTVTDVNPLNASDPSGLVLFYIALACTIIGFVGAIQTRVNAARLTLGGELAWDVVRAALVALIVSLTAGPILGFESFPVLPVWALLTVAVFVAGSVYSFFRVVIGGKWALMPTWILFILVSNPSSGGAVAPQLLPPFYEFMGRWLPTGSTVSALRDLTYFPGYPHPEPSLVLGTWLVLSTVAFVVARRLKYGTGRIPA